MPKFVIEREIPGLGNLSEDQLQATARKSVAVLLRNWARRSSG